MKIITKSLELANELFPSFCSDVENRTYHFCFVYRRNRLLTIGRNDMKKTSPFLLRLANKFAANIKLNFPFIHAEIDAITRLWGRTWIDSSLNFVNIRLNKVGKICNSKPCSRCGTILSGLGVNNIWYSTKDEQIVRD